MHEASAPQAPQLTQPARTSRLAIASLVLGVVAIASQVVDILAFWLPIPANLVVYMALISLIGVILALRLGWAAKRQIDQAEGTTRGRGIANAGIALGWIGVGGVVLGVAFVLLVLSTLSIA